MYSHTLIHHNISVGTLIVFLLSYYITEVDQMCCFAGLYITYPHDKRNAKKVGQALSDTLLEGALLNK